MIRYLSPESLGPQSNIFNSTGRRKTASLNTILACFSYWYGTCVVNSFAQPEQQKKKNEKIRCVGGCPLGRWSMCNRSQRGGRMEGGPNIYRTCSSLENIKRLPYRVA